MYEVAITIMNKKDMIEFLTLKDSTEKKLFRVYTSSMAQLYKLIRLYKEGSGDDSIKIIPNDTNSCYIAIAEKF